jgi:chain length determinant protein EpsF
MGDLTASASYAGIFSMTLKQLLLILRGRWRIVALVLSVGILAGVAATFLMPKQYVAAAAVVVDIRPDPLSDAVNAVQPTSFLATQVDIITSDQVARRVVSMVKLNEDPVARQQWIKRTGGVGDINAWLADGIRNKLNVNPARDSNVISIAMKASDPKSAATLANAFAQAYIDTSIQLRVQPAKQDAAFFDERYQALRQDLAQKQKMLSEYQNQHGIVPTDERINTENTRLSELTTQLVNIQSQRQDSESRGGEAAHAHESLPDVLQSPVIIALKTDLARAEAQQQQIATRLGTGHPESLSLQAQIDGLRSRIAQETQNITASLRASVHIDAQRERGISAAIEAQKQRILDLTTQRDEAANLQNDVIRAQRNLDAVSQHLAQSNLESQTRQASIELLAAATEPLKPSSPNRLINMALGIFLGSVLGIGLALLLEMEDRRIRTDDELLEIAGVPMLGVVRRSVSGLRRPAIGFADPPVARLRAPQAGTG